MLYKFSVAKEYTLQKHTTWVHEQTYIEIMQTKILVEVLPVFPIRPWFYFWNYLYDTRNGWVCTQSHSSSWAGSLGSPTSSTSRYVSMFTFTPL